MPETLDNSHVLTDDARVIKDIDERSCKNTGWQSLGVALTPPNRAGQIPEFSPLKQTRIDSRSDEQSPLRYAFGLSISRRRWRAREQAFYRSKWIHAWTLDQLEQDASQPR